MRSPKAPHRRAVIFRSLMVCSKSNRGRYASPALAAASYPFVDLPSGDTLRCKLFPADKFYKISLYFDGRIKYNEVNDKSEFEAEVCIMNIGFWSCIILVIPFLIIGVLFAIFKEKAAKFVSGFNSFSKEEQALYDKAYISRDIRNQCFMWAIIMLAGALLSCFLTPYIAIPTYIIWLVLFFREVHFDNHKAFEKYLLK